MMKQNIDRLVNEIATKAFKEPGKDPVNWWVVLVDGKRVAMMNKKYIWKQKGHAKLAVLNHLEEVSHFLTMRRLRGNSMYDYTHTEVEEAKKRWIDEHVEIMTLDAWKDMQNGE